MSAHRIYKVRQRHREAAARWITARFSDQAPMVREEVANIRAGRSDHNPAVQAYAEMEHPMVRFFLNIRDLWT